MLGSRWVAERADDPLRDAARSALTRIRAVLPAELRDELDTSALLIGPGTSPPPDLIDLSTLRHAIRAERKVSISYRGGKGDASLRVIWPFALSFFDQARVLVAWCELRQGFRHFRTDRIVAVEVLERRYPQRRQALLRQWREAEGILLRDS